MVVVATDQEYIEARKRFKNELILKTGVGGLNVIESLSPIDRNEEIINFGYVGSNVIPIGVEVTISESMLYHPGVSYKEPSYQLSGDIKCYTSNDFVTKTNIKEPVVFDMELAYILAMGFKNVESIKIVSDNLNLHEYVKVVGYGERETIRLTTDI